MPGFLGCFNCHSNEDLFYENDKNDLINEIISEGSTFVERRTINKFLEDKVFYNDKNYLIVTEGVILNSLDLIKKYLSYSLKDAIINMYEINGQSFFNEFRGSFSGLLFDKKEDKKILFTNHTGDKQVFYTQLNGAFVFGSEINYIVEYYEKQKEEYNLDKNSAYSLLTYGYMLEDNTLFCEIKKIKAGHYILITNNKEAEIIQYYKINNTPDNHRTEEEIIENIDSLFRKAIVMSFEKDKQYGYKHLVPLSGGLDSRMTTWVANDLGYGENIVNYTFSQSNYLDETIAKEIASDLEHEWLFMALDNGLFMRNIDKVVKISGGSVLYYGLSHQKRFSDFLNLFNFGIVHTGQVGGILKGYYNSQMQVKQGGEYSNMITHRYKQDNISNYKNESEFLLYNRQFNGTLQGNLPLQEKTETFSPFLDIDFVNYSLRIPDKFNKNEIFIKWMIQKYPESTKYIWEEKKGKVTEPMINIFNKQVLLSQVPKKIVNFILNKVGFVKTMSGKNHMNPLDYWYNDSEEFREFMDDYFESNINLLSYDKDLLMDCRFMYTKGSGIEKVQVLTLLSALKLYF